MQSFDHYPWDDGQRADLLTSIHDALSLVSVPPPVVPPLPTAQRFVKRGMYMVCTTCDMAVEWCACAKQPVPAVQSKDGGESSLEARARRCMGGK